MPFYCYFLCISLELAIFSSYRQSHDLILSMPKIKKNTFIKQQTKQNILGKKSFWFEEGTNACHTPNYITMAPAQIGLNPSLWSYPRITVFKCKLLKSSLMHFPLLYSVRRNWSLEGMLWSWPGKPRRALNMRKTRQKCWPRKPHIKQVTESSKLFSSSLT